MFKKKLKFYLKKLSFKKHRNNDWNKNKINKKSQKMKHLEKLSSINNLILIPFFQLL